MKLLKSKTPLDAFVPHVVAQAMGSEDQPSLPESAAISFIRNSAIRFAEKTQILKEEHHIDLQCGLQCYPLETEDCETVISVEEAQLGEFFNQNCTFDWNWGGVRFNVEDDVLNICPAPTKDIDNGLRLKLTVAPSRDCCEVDSVLYDKWFDAIVWGALSEIHMMPGRPWSSAGRADYRRNQFEDEVGRATVRDIIGHTREPLLAWGNNDFIKCRTSQRRW